MINTEVAQRETLSAEIDKIVGQVKKSILEVEKDAPVGQKRLAITEALLTLNAGVTKDVRGDFKFTLFGHDFGPSAELSKADTQTIELKLKPSTADAETFGPDDVSEKLVNAMRAIRQSVSAAAASQPRFDMGESSIELNFQIDKSGNIDFFVSGTAKSTNVQTIKLTLASAS